MNNDKLIRSLLLVKVTAHGWGGGSGDAEAATEYAQSKGADASRYSVFVDYLPEELAAQIRVAKQAVRGVWLNRTLPFKDGGWRVLLAEHYLDLMEALSKPKSEYEAVTNAVLARYDEIVAEAKKALNGGFKPELLPSLEQLQKRYWVELKTEPVMSSDDIRVEGLTDAASEMVRASVEASVAASLKLATTTAAETLLAMVREFSRKIDEVKAGRNVIFGKLAKHAAAQCDALRDLNLSRDPQVDATIQKVRDLLTAGTVDTDTAKGWAGDLAKKKANTLCEEIAQAFGGAA
jgi:hypothetical protein